MRADAILKLPHRYDLHEAITSQDFAGEITTTWVFKESGYGRVVHSPQTGGVSLITREALPIRSALVNVLDSRGNEVFTLDGQGYVMYVVDIAPQVDMFGNIIGWKNVLKRNLPMGTTGIITNVATGG